MNARTHAHTHAHTQREREREKHFQCMYEHKHAHESELDNTSDQEKKTAERRASVPACRRKRSFEGNLTPICFWSRSRLGIKEQEEQERAALFGSRADGGPGAAAPPSAEDLENAMSLKR